MAMHRGGGGEQIRRTVRPLQEAGTDKGRTSGNRMGVGVSRTGGTWAAKFEKKIISWDIAPKQEYFDELFRVSRNQIVWGGNYFSLPPTRCFIVWRKSNIPEKFTMSMCEYAWTSFNDNAKVFDYSSSGQAGRFHPTQKPVALYEWILANYAKKDDIILDTHAGSASSLVACQRLGRKYVGFEIDEDYYRLAQNRLNTEGAQMTIWNYNPYQE